MKIVTKLTLLSLSTLVFWGAFGLYYMNISAKNAVMFEQAAVATHIGNKIFEMTALSRDPALSTKSERPFIQWKILHSGLRDLLATKLFKDKNSDKNRANLAIMTENFDNIFGELTKAIKKQELGQIDSEVFQELQNRLASQMSIMAQAMMTSANRLSESAQSAAKTVQDSTTRAIISIATIVILTSALSWYLFGKNLIGSIRKLQRGSEEIARGNFEYRLANDGKDELADLAQAFDHMADAVNAREGELSHIASTDSLTGLHNRRAFFERLEFTLAQARRSKLPCALIMFDVDNFKEINDLLGHETGDDVLVAIAKTMKEQLRETDTIARLGGDEFAIIAPNLNKAGDAIEIAEKIIAAVNATEDLNDTRVNTGVSAGITVFPMDDSDTDILLSHADMAMYKAKAIKKGTAGFFNEQMDKAIKVRQALKENMSNDLSNGKFYLHFQPIVDADTHEIISAEGLARWRDADGKIIYPAEFIPIAEEAKMISDLGDKLFEEACGYIRQWNHTDKLAVPISLNISPIQLRDPNFSLRIIAKLEKFGIDGRFINIEITESDIIENIEMAQTNLGLLKRYGIGIHIDDFGTGYSSLSLLKDLPLDVLKIDMSFVQEIVNEIRARSIIQAIVNLSRTLEFRTIAEGVETKEQAAILRDMGVDFLQGYYFSPPVEVEKFTGLLAKTRTCLSA